MSDFNIGDEVFWINMRNGFPFEGILIKIDKGIYKGDRISYGRKTIAVTPNNKNDSWTQEIFGTVSKSKNEAIDAMIKRLEEMRDE